MKAVIEGKAYNTESAKLIGSDSYGNGGDFDHWEESPYMTKRGAFFIAGSGGPMSHYARPCGRNRRTGGESILVLSEAEARAWCEEHEVPVDMVASHFEVEEA